MDVHAVSITNRDIERIKAEVNPAEFAGVGANLCSIYADGRHWILAAIAILQFCLPQAAAVLTAVVAGLDAACKGQSGEESSQSHS